MSKYLHLVTILEEEQNICKKNWAELLEVPTACTVHWGWMEQLVFCSAAVRVFNHRWSQWTPTNGFTLLWTSCTFFFSSHINRSFQIFLVVNSLDSGRREGLLGPHGGSEMVWTGFVGIWKRRRREYQTIWATYLFYWFYLFKLVNKLK